jgi:hypothetical protein
MWQLVAGLEVTENVVTFTESCEPKAQSSSAMITFQFSQLIGQHVHLFCPTVAAF